MDVTFVFFSVTVVALFGNGEQVKSDNCNTTPPSFNKCKELGLEVKNGRACYSGSFNTLASISCIDMYTADVNILFECTGNSKTWTPGAKATCSPKAAFTSKLLLPSEGSSQLLPSERTLFTTGTYSVTSFMPTSTLMSKTKGNELSSKLRTMSSTINPSTVLLTQFYTSSTTNATSILVTDIAASQKVNDSDINVAYIVTPVAVCAIALLFGIGILWWWRCRTHKPSAFLKRREPGSLITNQLYETNVIDRHCSLSNVRQSRVNEYAEISLDIMNTDDSVGDNYQSIDILPEDKADMKKSYDNFKLSETEFIDTNYSHIGLNNTQNNNHADKTYSHTQLENGPQKPEITVSGDDTYNKLHSATLHEKRCQDTENSDTEYSHARAGRQDPENESDNYSHLNTNMRAPGASTGKSKHQFEDGTKNKNSNILQLSAKDPPSSTGYEFAKDFDNLESRREGLEYAKVTKKKPVFNEAHGAVDSYETAASTTHNYLILEPDTNSAHTSTLFKVVEDLSAETDEIPEVETGHEYFTLEKQDI